MSLLATLAAVILPTAMARADSFAPTGSMRLHRQAHSATLLKNGNVLIVGGLVDDNFSVSTASAELYGPSTGLFSSSG